MTPSSRSPSAPSVLSPSIQKQLNGYALAAGAAGVGLLALASPSEARIIYTKSNLAISPKTTLHLDLNHDGIADFDLVDGFRTSFATAWGWLSALPDRKSNAIWGHTVPSQAYASALSADVQVGPRGQFLPGTGVMAATKFLGGRPHSTIAYGSGPWANVTSRYLGLKFVIEGKIHFGWARLKVSVDSIDIQVSAILTGYAYQTVANRPILTGQEREADETDDSSPAADQTSSLGQLAAGKSRFNK